MKTASLWGTPPSRYYRYLQRVRDCSSKQHPTLAVVGCADGKYVVPAARLGFRVWAIDIDEVALFGGEKHDAGGPVEMPGLVARVREEGLEKLVEVVHGDFAECPPGRRFDGVFTSGALQYSNNIGRSLEEMVTAVGDCVRPAGLLYIDYMLPYEEKYRGRPNCPEAGWWREYFTGRPQWEVRYNRVMRPTLDRAHVEYPVDHYHQWGHLLAARTRRG